MAQSVHPIDKHVGNRLRLRRTILGYSQEKLGEALSLTYQQVQKYERGVNRISVSRLHDICKILHVPITFFFEDMPGLSASGEYGTPTSGFSGGLQDKAKPAYGDELDDPLTREETLKLVHAYYRLPNATARRKFLDLLQAMSHSNPEKLFSD